MSCRECGRVLCCVVLCCVATQDLGVASKLAAEFV